MSRGTTPGGAGNNTFWEEHRKCFLIAAAVLLAAAVITAIVIGAKPKRKIVDHITAEYTGDTKAGVVLDDKNTGFIVTAYFKDGHSEKVTGWSIAEPQTLQDAEVSVVTITYEKASTQCEVQCTSGLIQSITAEYDGETSAGTQISDTNPGIHVYAIRDGNKTPVESGWRVANPSVLEKEKITTVNIEYEGFSCALSIQCTTREIVRLTASYKGSTEEGTVISTGCKDLTVTAKYADRTSEEVDKWTLAESVTLEPKERYILEIHYEDSVCTLEVTCTTPTPEEFKAGCISASYSSLYRNPAKYTGTNVVVEGTIAEIRPGTDGSTEVFIEMSGDFLGLTSGMLCATYTKTLHGQLPPEGVPVKIYGMYREVSARMMDGSSMTMPVMNAEYVDKR